MKISKLLACSGVLAALLSGSAASLHAELITCPPSIYTVLPAGSAWQYTFADPSANPDWMTFGGTDTVTWFTGNAPFGNNYADSYNADFHPNTDWPANANLLDDLWIRARIDLTGLNPDLLVWELGVDNGFTLYFNGALQDSANAEGYTERWEYSGELFGATSGLNSIALALEDHGGLTAFDLQVTGVEYCHPFTPVPEPSTYGLIAATALVGVVVLRRRSRRTDHSL